MLKMKNQKEKSFTLLELLVVIAIIAILAATVMVSLNSTRQSAQEARGLKFSQNIKSTLATDLVAEWTFDSVDIQGTTVKDTSGNNNNGTINGGATSTQGKVRQALNLDGTDDYVRVLHSTSLNITNAITIEAWIKLAEDREQSIVRKENAYLTKSFNNPSGLSFYLYINSDWRTVNSNYRATDYNWHHLVGTYDSNEKVLKVYVDGALKNSSTLSDLSSYLIDSNNNNLFLGSNNGTSEFFKGILDEVRIYSRALTAYEIKALYAQGKMRHLAER